MESKKLYYTMGEVSEMFCVAPSLIRHWEKHFTVIKPQRNKKGNRLFTPSDVDNFKIIYHLVKERGMTLEGAQRTMRQGNKSESRDAELLERLQHIRSLLLEVREELKEPAPHTHHVIDCKSTAKDSIRCTLPIDEDTKSEVEDESDEPPVTGEPIDHSTRNNNRTPDAESKELFAFYEQSLF